MDCVASLSVASAASTLRAVTSPLCKLPSDVRRRSRNADGARSYSRSASASSPDCSSFLAASIIAQTWNRWRWAPALPRRSAEAVRRSAEAVRRSAEAVRRSAEAVRRTAEAVRRTAVAMRRMAAARPAMVTVRRAMVAARRAMAAARQRPAAEAEPAQVQGLMEVAEASSQQAAR